MRRDLVKAVRTLGFTVVLVAGLAGMAQAQWTKVSDGSGNTGTAPGAGPQSAGTCLLLTDGSVMCQEDANGLFGSVDPTHWWRLKPDNSGSYTTGTWSKLTAAPSNYGPLFYCSAVLADGRVVVIGGEFNQVSGGTKETTLGYIFDPTGNGGSGQWTSSAISMGTTGWTQIGDSICGVQADGTLTIGLNANGQMASLDPSTQTLSLVNSPKLENSKADGNGQEGWTLLPDGTILTVDTSNCGSSGECNITAGTPAIGEIFSPSSNLWSVTGSTIVTLDGNVPNCCVPEMGPQILRPDGTVIAFGATPNTATYNYKTGVWTAGPTFPTAASAYPSNSSCNLSSGNYPSAGAADGPGSLLPNGNVLVASSPVDSSGNELNCSAFFEYDGTNLNPVTGPSAASSQPTFQMRLLLLPSGQVLFTDTVGDVDIYTPGGTYQAAWQPTISSFPAVIGQGETYKISGTQFNGLSQASGYGDDATMATNYPLVRITDSGGNVIFARTHDHSTMGVATGSATVSTNFDAPSTLALGTASLVVIADGIPSASVSVNVELGSSLALTGGSATSGDFNDAVTVQAQLSSGGSPLTSPSEQITFVLGSGAGSETCSAMTDGTGTATCQITPNQAAGSYTLTATFGGDSTYAGSSTSTTFSTLLEESSLAFTGSSATTSDFDDAVTVQAQMTDPIGGAPIQNEPVTLSLGSGTGSETCSTMTDGSGLATCSITPNQAAGGYTLTATFAGDAFYSGSSTSTPFTITKEETTVMFTAGSPTVIANGFSTTFSATLLEDGITPISGRMIKITIGAQSCLTSATDLTGTGSCPITLSQPLGPGTITANFAGDGFYLPSSKSEPVIVFAFLNRGAMVIGDLDSAIGTPVAFWGSQWSKMNSVSGGFAPSAFKGFAGVTAEPPACGGSWTTGTGNSAVPPATVPSYMGVIVSSQVLQNGSTVFSGNVVGIIVVKTNPGYSPMPGTTGTGTVVATFCGK